MKVPAPQTLPILYRVLTIEVAERAGRADDDRIPVSLSSDIPCERWWGKEILSHSKDAVDMRRAKNGLPLLMNHDTYEQMGRIEEIKLEGDKLRGLMRFSKSDAAQVIRQDVLDGIRQETSIGYRIQEMKLVSSDETGDTYEATRWMPLEGSLVAVPADETVGVGRSAEGTAAPVKVTVPDPAPLERALPPGGKMEQDEKGKTPPVTGGEDLTKVERERSTQIMRMAREHKMETKAADWIEQGSTVEQVRVAILDTLVSRAKDDAGKVTTGTMEGLDIPAAERKEYSLARAILQAADGWTERTFERDVHEALNKQARKNGSTPLGNLMVPLDLGITKRAGLDSKTTTAGLELKFTEPGSFIELLRNSTKVMGLGATFLPGLQGNVAFPRQTGAGTFSWQAENPGSDVSDSNLALDQVTISPKLGLSTSSYSRNLLTQAVVDVEQMIRQDLALITAIGIDLAAIDGTGASNQPKGITSQTGVGVVTLGANGGTVSWNALVDVIKTVDAGNALRGKLGWLTTPGQRAQMSKLAQISATTGIPIWWQGEVAGYPADSSTNVPSNKTKGTSTTICHIILFGNWQELLIGQWNSFDIIVDPYRLKKQAMIELTSYVSVDIALRHGPSFTQIPDAL